jgi:diketogulonate reductase-like aldo/keto reductase
MEFRSFGPTARKVSVIGQGSWEIETANRDVAIASLRQGLDFGMNHIDTAEMYGAGMSELIIGEAIENRRDEVFLVSKVLPQNATRKGTIAACEKSLSRLKTDRLDCYLLHWRGPHPLEETVAAFADLKSQGKIVSWGVSNFDVEDLEEVYRLGGNGELACNQVLYHLLQRGIEHRVIPWCEQHGVAVVGYSPFGHGEFPSDNSHGGKLLRDIAIKYGATPRQVALRFLTRQLPLFTIPKASALAHCIENACGDFTLSGDDVETINATFPLGPKSRRLAML